MSSSSLFSCSSSGVLSLLVMMLSFSLASVVSGEERVVRWCDWGSLDWTEMKQGIVAWNATNPEFQGIVQFTSVRDTPELLAETSEATGVAESKVDWGIFLDYDLRLREKGLCDVLILGGTSIHLAEEGLTEFLDDHVSDPRLRWDEMSLPTRRFVAEWQDRKIISVPLQIEFPMLFYRRDLISVAPRTWEAAIAEASKWHGKDLNGYNASDPNNNATDESHFGFCMDPAGDIGRLSLGVFASIMKYLPGQRQGFMYDLAADESAVMTPLFNTKGYVYGLSILRQMYQLSNQEFDAVRWRDVVTKWEDGKCAMYLTWAAVGGSAQVSDYYVHKRSGTARMPGSTMVYDRSTKDLVECDLSRCPFMESGSMNRPSMLSGGNRFVVRKNPKNMALAMELIIQASMRVDVRLKDNVPFRDDQYNRTWFEESGWDSLDAEEYLNSLLWTSTSQHVVKWPSIPTVNTNWRFIEEAIRKACRAPPFQANTQTDEEIVAEIDANVTKTTREQGYSLIFLDNQLRSAEGLPPLDVQEDEVTNRVMIAIIVSLMVVVLLSVLIIAVIQSRNKIFGSGSSSSQVNGGGGDSVSGQDGDRTPTSIFGGTSQKHLNSEFGASDRGSALEDLHFHQQQRKENGGGGGGSSSRHNGSGGREFSSISINQQDV